MTHEIDRTAELMTDADIGQVDLHVTTILVATDGSEPAVEATKVAISLAKRLGAKVVALFVAPAVTEDPMEYVEMENLERVRHSDAGLAVALKLGAVNGVEVIADSREGAVTHEILSAIEDHGAQMVVIGTEGRTGIKRLVLGSVAHAVVKHSHVPVTVVGRGSSEFA